MDMSWLTLQHGIYFIGVLVIVCAVVAVWRLVKAGKFGLIDGAYTAGLVTGLAVWIKLAAKQDQSIDMGFLGYCLLIMCYCMGRTFFAQVETAILAKWAPDAAKMRLSQQFPAITDQGGPTP